MREICVLLMDARIGRDRRQRAKSALARRGFEVFAERELGRHERLALPCDLAAPETKVLVAFDPLIEAEDPPGRRFAHASIEAAAFHLGTTLGPDARGMKVAGSVAHATAIMAAVLTAEERAALKDRIAERRSEMHTDEPVLSVLSRHRHRAKVELVDFDGTPMVKKTFRATARQAMANEIAFHDDIAPRSPVPARILHRSKSALYFEFIPHRPVNRQVLGRSVPRRLPLTCLGQLADFARLVTGRGWDPIDLTPRDNVLVENPGGALRCIDFEFARRREAPVPPRQAAFLSGLSEADPAAAEFDIGMRQDPYPGKWRPFTGVSRESFLGDPAWLQAGKRAGQHPGWLLWRALGAPARRRAHLQRRALILDMLFLPEES